MTALTELREEAALQPDGSRAKRLLTWAEIHFGDSAERISELEEDCTQMDIEREGLRHALRVARDALEVVVTYCSDRAYTLNPDTFTRDFSGHINLMGAQGDPDYKKGDLNCRHVDLREKAPNLCGIHWKSAKVTLKSGDNAVLYGTTSLLPPKIDGVGSASTPQNEVVYIRLDRSRIFLARVSTAQMRAQGNVVAAETLLALQIEWAEALHSYETNGIAVKRGRREDLGDLGLLYKLRGMAETPEERAALSRQIADHHNEMGYPLIPCHTQIPLFEGGAA